MYSTALAVLSAFSVFVFYSKFKIIYSLRPLRNCICIKVISVFLCVALPLWFQCLQHQLYRLKTSAPEIILCVIVEVINHFSHHCSFKNTKKQAHLYICYGNQIEKSINPSSLKENIAGYLQLKFVNNLSNNRNIRLKKKKV